MVAFESVARLLHFLHFVAAITTVAACVHLQVRLWPKRGHPRVRLHALTLLIGYITTYTLGALMYPTFRVRVRADLLDSSYPWASGLFEIKEHAATLIFLPVVGIFVLSRVVNFATDDDRHYARLLRGLVGIVLCVLVYNACVGWYLGTVRSV
jgi:hypothetical protein